MTAPKFEDIRLVVFDLDGTLVDAFEDIAAAANYIRQLNAMPLLSVDEVKRHVGHGARELVRRVLGIADEALIESNLQSLVNFYSTHPSGTTTLYPGVHVTLDSLRRRGIQTAVASNKPDPVTSQVLVNLGVRDKLDHAAGERPGTPRKPAPDMLHRVMSAAGVSPEQTLMVGDSDVDIAFARAAGAGVISVTYGQYDSEYLQRHEPDAFIDRLEDLLPLLV